PRSTCLIIEGIPGTRNSKRPKIPKRVFTTIRSLENPVCPPVGGLAMQSVVVNYIYVCAEGRGLLSPPDESIAPLDRKRPHTQRITPKKRAPSLRARTLGDVLRLIVVKKIERKTKLPALRIGEEGKIEAQRSRTEADRINLTAVIGLIGLHAQLIVGSWRR